MYSYSLYLVQNKPYTLVGTQDKKEESTQKRTTEEKLRENKIRNSLRKNKNLTEPSELAHGSFFRRNFGRAYEIIYGKTLRKKFQK